MQQVLSILSLPDYEFLNGLIDNTVNLTNDVRLRNYLAASKEEDSAENRAALDKQMEYEIRYLGSSEIAYFTRYLIGKYPGVSFREIVKDVSRVLKVNISMLGTDREIIEELVQDYATKQFAELTPEEQQKMLVDLGVERDKARKFILKSAGVFSLPLLIEAFDLIIVQGLIKTIIFGTIAKIIGQQLASRLFTLLAGRLPWWVSWIGPAAWSISLGWTALDLQGPALRKTVPIILYLGLCSLRERQRES